MERIFIIRERQRKNLPVSVGIKYYMDGTEVSPEALAGKTGHLKMEVTYTNTSKNNQNSEWQKRLIFIHPLLW